MDCGATKTLWWTCAEVVPLQHGSGRRNRTSGTMGQCAGSACDENVELLECYTCPLTANFCTILIQNLKSASARSISGATPYLGNFINSWRMFHLALGFAVEVNKLWQPVSPLTAIQLPTSKVSDFLEMSGIPDAHGALLSQGLLHAWKPGNFEST